MLERMKDVLRNRKEQGDKGFSLVELAVVIAIIAVLVAIAVPIFIGMQSTAEAARDDANAANGASVVAAEVARLGGSAPIATIETLLGKMDPEPELTKPTTGNVTLENYCVSSGTSTKGPDC